MKNGDKYANDNFDPWQSIGLQAALIVNKLRIQAQLANFNKEETEQSKGEPKSGSEPEKDPKADAEYVLHRLREISAWERKISGRKI